MRIDICVAIYFLKKKILFLILTTPTETKQLKSLVRNIVDPSRDLGHVDRALAKKQGKGEDVAVADQGGKADITQTQAQTGSTTTADVCKDCG